MAAVTTLTLRLIREFARDIRSSFTIRQLAQKTNTPYPNIHATTTKLLKEGILQKTTVGHSHLCSLNLRNETTRLLLALSLANHDELPAKIVKLQRNPNVLLVIRREEDLLVITEREEPQEFSGETWITDIDNDTLATIGKHRLLVGHATYAHLLRRFS